MIAAAVAGFVWLAWIQHTVRPVAALPTTQPATPPSEPVLRIGLVPEYEVFALRRSYQPLIAYLSDHLGRKVETVTLGTYEAVLLDFQDQQLDGAFLGALTAFLTMDRYNAQVVAKPEKPDGSSTYQGIIFVRDDSPIQSLDQLPGHSIAMLRATTAGSLFPLSEMAKRGLLTRPDAPRFVWMGTHDDVIEAVISGQADVGAVKSVRLNSFDKAHGAMKVRRLAASPAVPNNALVLRDDIAGQWGPKITQLLLDLDKDPAGRQALKTLGATRFVPCARREYDPLYDMIETVGPAWNNVGVIGPAPRRPAPNAKIEDNHP
jgi:phosphonate transport system substrate-binding protein